MQKAPAEEWCDIEGYEGLYQISSLGRVKSLARHGRGDHILSQCINPYGYPTVSLLKEGKLSTRPVHRLVAIAFIPNQMGKPEVNHIDGNKTNAKVGNLEWITKSENAAHACKLGLRDLEKARNARKRRVVRSDGLVFSSIADAARHSGSTTQNVWSVLNGKRKTAGGYAFSYAERASRTA